MYIETGLLETWKNKIEVTANAQKVETFLIVCVWGTFFQFPPQKCKHSPLAFILKQSFQSFCININLITALILSIFGWYCHNDNRPESAGWWSEEESFQLSIFPHQIPVLLSHQANSPAVSFHHLFSTFLVGGSLVCWVLWLRPHFEFWELSGIKAISMQMSCFHSLLFWQTSVC